MTFGITTEVAISLCEDASDAISKGHVYHGGVRALTFERVVIIRKGTISGKPTIDLVFRDAEGNKYVNMISGTLLKSLAAVVWE